MPHTSNAQFSARWARGFESAPPLGYRLIERFPHRWVRFHSLPFSKRYPDTEAEYRALLDRHNVVATELFQSGADVYVLPHLYGMPGSSHIDTAPDTPDIASSAVRYFRRFDARALHPQADPADDPPVDVWIAQLTWNAGVLDAMIRRVAAEQGPGFVVVNAAVNRVYAPYDGGADLFLEDAAVRDAWKARLAPWLSTHPSGR